MKWRVKYIDYPKQFKDDEKEFMGWGMGINK